MINVLLEKIQRSKLTKTDQKIADYLLQNPERFGILSVMDIAKEIGVSDASVIRFTRAIGYSGFSELKNAVYLMLAEEAKGRNSVLPLSSRYEKNAEQFSEEGISQQYLDIVRSCAEKSFNENSQDVYAQTVSIISNAGIKYVFGTHGCYSVAYQFARLLGFMLENVVLVSTQENEAIACLQSVKQGDILVIFSFARYYKTEYQYAKLAYDRGCPICLITDSWLCPMSKFAEKVLVANTAHMSFFNSTIGATTISEYLLTLLSRRDPDKIMQRIKERDELTNEYRL